MHFPARYGADVVLTYDELQRKYGELVARLNTTEEFRKGGFFTLVYVI